MNTILNRLLASAIHFVIPIKDLLPSVIICDNIKYFLISVGLSIDVIIYWQHEMKY